MDSNLISKVIQTYDHTKQVLEKVSETPHFQQLKSILALVALLKFGGSFVLTIHELGFSEIFRKVSLWIKVGTFTFAKSLPFMKEKVQDEINKELRNIEKSILGPTEERNKYTKFLQLPTVGISEDQIFRELDSYQQLVKHSYQGGKISGTVYNADDILTELLIKSMARFPWANPLHPTVFPAVRKMEAEVVAMIVDMYHGTDLGCCGALTSGGTESILMTCRAHKEWAYAEKGITRPHMVIPVTAHAAFDKAGDYFGIRITHVPVNPVTFKVDLEKVKRAICRNTIMVVGSCPGFPHGIIDDIDGLSTIAVKHNIGLHVDCCLGGFVVPFMEAAGYSIPLFDFRLPGVTSISADPHKYGCAPKGTSAILYRTPDLRRYQFFCAPNWPGGVYASPTIAGSRPGNLIVGCWTSMLYHGVEGYVRNTKNIVSKTLKMKEAVKSHPELLLLGDPISCVVAFGSTTIDPYRVGGLLVNLGWDLGWIQFPSGIHYSVTNLTDADAFVADLAQVMEQVRKEPNSPPTDAARTYGAATAMPDRNVIDRLARGFVDALYIPL